MANGYMSKYDVPMMKTAYIWADMSKCIRSKVGAVISIDNRIISIGYNGTVKGQDNCCEKTESLSSDENPSDFVTVDCFLCNGTGKVVDFSTIPVSETKCNVCNGVGKLKWFNETSEFTLHAEANALMFCLRNGISVKGGTIYVTLSPCKECSKLIAQAGIKRVVYSEEYRNTDGIDFLKKCGIDITRLEMESD